jgi:hypothetical protein
MGSNQGLNSYLREVRSEPFRWGHHDCLTFSNGAFKAFHGFGYADDWLGEYLSGRDPLIPSRMREKFGAQTFDEAIERRLRPVDHIPPRGALLATKRAERWLIGYALGICLGTKAAFLSRAGVIYLPLDDVAKAWVPK